MFCISVFMGEEPVSLAAQEHACLHIDYNSVMIALCCIEERSIIVSRCEEEPINLVVPLILVLLRNIYENRGFILKIKREMCNVSLYSSGNKREMCNQKLYVSAHIRLKNFVKSFGTSFFWNTTVDGGAKRH